MPDTASQSRDSGATGSSRLLEHWRAHLTDTERASLDALAADDAAELDDAFRSTLAFGTGGLRGVRGIGPNRMNVYTVGQATRGLATYLNAHFDSPTVVIARDSRHDGELFVRRIACVLAASGIESWVFSRPVPTPLLSFSVRHLSCSAGVNVTASHNPAAYSGYKAYAQDGCQIVTRTAADIQAAIDATDPFDDVEEMPFDEAVSAGLVRVVPDDVVDAYCKAVLSQSTGTGVGDLRVSYTPLNGTGLECVSRVLASVGLPAERLHVVDAQAACDGDFPTCPYPNPEVDEALELGCALARETDSDLLVATDPDADRLGVMVRHGGEMVRLGGNEVGMLLTDFLAGRAREAGCDLSRKVVWTTVVSAPVLDAMAREQGFELRRSLTGFKYAGEQIALLEAEGRADDFLFGFEESCGYLSGTYARDKDAVVATMLVCEMAAHYAACGIDLIDAAYSLFEQYGWWAGHSISVAHGGGGGASRMRDIMERLRADPPASIGALGVCSVSDFACGLEMPVIGGDRGERHCLPASDLLEFHLEGGSRVLVRPSGTEPKIKAYVYATAKTREEASSVAAGLEAAARELLA